jgi:hypothetical protein
MRLKQIFIGLTVLLLLVCLGSACATSTQSAAKGQDALALPDPAKASSPVTQSTDHADDHAQEDNVPRTKAADAVKLVKEGNAILVDVRDIGSYETMHAKGAIHVSYQDIQNGKFEKLPKDKPLIFYCT